MDPLTHKRFLDYREKFVYFGRSGMVILSATEFATADAEHRALLAKERRDDEEEARLAELAHILFHD